VQFHSGLLPRWCRRAPKVAEVLPPLYLHGLSSLDLVPELEQFFGASSFDGITDRSSTKRVLCMNTVRPYRTWPPRPGLPTRLHLCSLALNASAVEDMPLLGGSGARRQCPNRHPCI
jgi:hypothetical protein